MPPTGPERHIEEGEEEQPHHVDEVPVPGGGFEAEMAGRCEMAGNGAAQTHGQENRTDDDMEAVKTGGHEEGRAVDSTEIADTDGKVGMRRIGKGRQRR